MVPVLVHQPDGVEHLHRMVGVEAREHLGDRAEVPVDELAEPAAVVHRAGAGAAAHEQLEARDAEGVLDVDREQADARRVARRTRERRGPKPRRRRRVPAARSLTPPDLADAIRVEVRGDRELAHGARRV